MLLALALWFPAHAADDACQACCRAGGLPGCEPTLRIYGEGSRLMRDGAAWRVVGAWDLACDGRATFDTTESIALNHAPTGGELVLTPVNPLQVHCFLQACSLPTDTCLSPPDDDGNYHLLGCTDGLPASATQLARSQATARSAPTRVVVLDGKPLVVETVTGSNANSPATSNTTRGASTSAAYSAPVTTNTSPAPTSTYSAPPAYTPPPTPAYTPPPTPAYTPPPTPAYTAPTSTYSAPPAHTPPPTPAYTPPPTPAYTPPPAYTAAPVATSAAPPALSGDAFTTFSTSLPADPPDVCKAPADALRSEARKRVDLGDEKRIRNDSQGALQEYRAALSMDGCNAYGWLGIGEIASEMARSDLAIRALRNTTRILPGHYGAWTLLGKNYEAIRQMTLAAEAYKKALDLRPGLTEAMDGWQRVSGG